MVAPNPVYRRLAVDREEPRAVEGGEAAAYGVGLGEEGVLAPREVGEFALDEAGEYGVDVGGVGGGVAEDGAAVVGGSEGEGVEVGEVG